ncbi:MAG: DUF3857 domain-containing protein [Bacteroidia bacterium]|nr:DUF3857 domain-containing protein [Bacteroidia bacterium]
MNKKIYRFPTLLIAGLFLSVITLAQHSDAVFNNIEKHYTLYPDGRMQYREVKDLTLNTHYAFNRIYGETFIVFNPEAQKLAIDEAYTLMADGKKVVAPENAFNPVLPRPAADFPGAAHLREMVVTHTALEVGAKIHLDYVINTEAGFYPALMDEIVIPQTDPVENMKIIVQVPEGTPFNYHITKLRTSPEIATDKGFTTYTFTFVAIKALSHDYWQKAGHSGDPVLTFSTSKDLHRLVDSYVNQKAFQLKVSPQMSKAVSAATKEAQSDMEKIAAIQDIVVNEIYHFGINEKHLGYQLRTPVEVWNSNGGTKAEKALLLAAMLRSGGMNANPVALFAPGTPDKKAGNLNEIKEYLVQVNPKEGKRIYLNTDQSNTFSAALNYPGYSALLLDAAVESLRFENFPGPDTKRNMSLKIVFEPEKSTITGAVTLSGKGVPVFNPVDTATHVREIKGLPVKTKHVTALHVSSVSSNITFEMETANPVKAKNGYFILDMPYLGNDPAHTWPYELQSSRTTDIDLGNGLDINYTFDISIPEGYAYVVPAEDVVLKNSFGAIAINYVVDGNRLKVTKILRVLNPVTEEQSWPEVKALFDLWRTENYSKLIIKAK